MQSEWSYLLNGDDKLFWRPRCAHSNPYFGQFLVARFLISGFWIRMKTTKIQERLGKFISKTWFLDTHRLLILQFESSELAIVKTQHMSQCISWFLFCWMETNPDFFKWLKERRVSITTSASMDFDDLATKNKIDSADFEQKFRKNQSVCFNAMGTGTVTVYYTSEITQTVTCNRIFA